MEPLEGVVIIVIVLRMIELVKKQEFIAWIMSCPPCSIITPIRTSIHTRKMFVVYNGPENSISYGVDHLGFTLDTDMLVPEIGLPPFPVEPIFLHAFVPEFYFIIIQHIARCIGKTK